VNKLLHRLLVVPAACAAPEAGAQTGKPINPGDRIGDFLDT
jgi:hypothetical protein